MKKYLREPLTYMKIFGLIEPDDKQNVIIMHESSIKHILDHFPIKYNDNLTEFEWTEEDCCMGWFLQIDKSTRVHAGCDGSCGKEVPEKCSQWFLKLTIIEHENNNIVEFNISTCEKTINVKVCNGRMILELL